MNITFNPFAANTGEQTVSWNGVLLRWPDGAPVKACDIPVGSVLTFDVDTGIVSQPEKQK